MLSTRVESPAAERGAAGESGTLEYRDGSGNLVEAHFNAPDDHQPEVQSSPDRLPERPADLALVNVEGRHDTG